MFMSYRFTNHCALPSRRASRKGEPQCTRWVPGIFFSLHFSQSGLEKSLHYREDQKGWEPVQALRQFQIKIIHELVSIRAQLTWILLSLTLSLLAFLCFDLFLLNKRDTVKSRGDGTCFLFLPQQGRMSREGEVALPALPGVTNTALAHRTLQTSGSLLYKS